MVDVDPPQRLITRHAGTVRVRFSTDEADLSWLERVPHVNRVSRGGTEIEVEGDGPLLAHVAAELVQRGSPPDDLRVERSTLEDVFLKLTSGEG